MKDTLTQQIAAGAGIPELGTRVTVLVIILVALSVGCLLLYMKMKDADSGLGAE